MYKKLGAFSLTLNDDSTFLNIEKELKIRAISQRVREISTGLTSENISQLHTGRMIDTNLIKAIKHDIGYKFTYKGKTFKNKQKKVIESLNKLVEIYCGLLF